MLGFEGAVPFKHAGKVSAVGTNENPRIVMKAREEAT